VFENCSVSSDITGGKSESPDLPALRLEIVEARIDNTNRSFSAGGACRASLGSVGLWRVTTDECGCDPLAKIDRTRCHVPNPTFSCPPFTPPMMGSALARTNNATHAQQS